MTKAELQDRNTELRQQLRLARDDATGAQELAGLGVELAKRWLRDKPMSHHSSGCVCHFCFAARWILRRKMELIDD